MRVSSSLLFDRGAANINSQQSKFSKVGEQIASGRRVVNPSDDPQASARALSVNQALDKVEQFEGARVSVRNSLSQTESVLGIANDLLIRARTLVTQASNGTLSDLDRNSVGSEIEGIFEALVGQANSVNGDGQYLFGGFKSSSDPFTKNVDGSVNYVGDDNVREERVDDTRRMKTGANGLEVFQTVQNGAPYLAEAKSTNSGTLTFVGPKVIDTNDPNFGNKFDLEFSRTGDEFFVSVDGQAPERYIPNQPFEFNGLSMVFEGEPDTGDKLEVGRGNQIKNDMFETLKTLADVLKTPAETDVQKANLQNTLSTATRKLGNNFDNILVVRAGMGASLNELDSIDVVAEQRTINLLQTRSDLIDINLVDAISEYSLRQTGLQAAQRAFADIGKLSLFDYL